MKLSAEQFAELASSFNTQPKEQQHEKRRAPRTDLQASVRITPVVSGRQLAPISVIISDFSARGIAFVESSPMEAGQQFVLELPRREGGNVSLLCTVMHVKPCGRNAYRIVAEFTCGVQPSSQSNSAHEKPDAAEVKRIRESMLR